MDKLSFKEKKFLVKEYVKANLTDSCFWNDQRSAFYKRFNVTEDDVINFAIEVNRHTYKSDEQIYHKCFKEIEEQCFLFLHNFCRRCDFKVELFMEDILSWQDVYIKDNYDAQQIVDVTYELNKIIDNFKLIYNKSNLQVITAIIFNNLRNFGLIEAIDHPPGLTRNYDCYNIKHTCKVLAKMLKYLN